MNLQKSPQNHSKDHLWNNFHMFMQAFTVLLSSLANFLYNFFNIAISIVIFMLHCDYVYNSVRTKARKKFIEEFSTNYRFIASFPSAKNENCATQCEFILRQIAHCQCRWDEDKKLFFFSYSLYQLELVAIITSLWELYCMCLFFESRMKLMGGQR